MKGTIKRVLAVALLLAVSLGVSASKVNIPGLYIAGEGKYDDSKVMGTVKYKNKDYKYYQVVGCPNCYYVKDLQGVYITNCTVKDVLLESTKNYSGTLPLLIRGKVTVNTGKDKSCIRMYYGHLIITKPDDAATPTLELNQKDSKKGMYTSRGGITIKDITLKISTKKNHIAINQEGVGSLHIDNAWVTTNGPIYARGGVTLADNCWYAQAGIYCNKESHYIEYENSRGKKVNDIEIVPRTSARTPSASNNGTTAPSTLVKIPGLRVGTCNQYDRSRQKTFSKKVNTWDVSGTYYAMHGLTGFWYNPEKKVIFMEPRATLNGSIKANSKYISHLVLMIGGNNKIMANEKYSIDALRVDVIPAPDIEKPSFMANNIIHIFSGQFYHVNISECQVYAESTVDVLGCMTYNFKHIQSLGVSTTHFNSDIE